MKAFCLLPTRMTNDWKRTRNIDSILPVGSNDLYFYK